MIKLVEKTCVPCKRNESSLNAQKIKELSEQTLRWEVVHNHSLKRSFKFINFVTALSFVNQIGEEAEQQGHHPNICFTWGKVDVEIWTHAIDGLHENDFILASKIDKLVLRADGLKE